MKTFKELTKKFDYVNSNITDELFPLIERKVGEYKLYHFNKYISSEDAIKEMKTEGYMPANLYELLLWSEENKQDWVVALGSVAGVDGNRRVPYLYRDGSERQLDLRWFDCGWGAYCRFLAVRNLDSEAKALGDSALRILENLTFRIEALEEFQRKVERFLILK